MLIKKAELIQSNSEPGINCLFYMGFLKRSESLVGKCVPLANKSQSVNTSRCFDELLSKVDVESMLRYVSQV